MHGFVLVEFENYIKDNYGFEAWQMLIEKSGLTPKRYEISEDYPDNESATLFTTASEVTSESVTDILRNFGRFCGTAILTKYAVPAIEPDWEAIDVIENVDKIMKHLATIACDEWNPSHIEAKRIGPDKLIMRYTSMLNICEFTKGVNIGIAEHYGNALEITDQLCMLKGDPCCEMLIRLVQ